MKRFFVVFVLVFFVTGSALADFVEVDSYYKFDPVLGVVDLVPYSLEDSQMGLSSEVVLDEVPLLEEAAPLLGSPSPSSSVDESVLECLAFVHVTSELGVGTLYVPRSYIQSLSLSSDGFVCNPLSNSVSGYFKTDDGFVYDVNAQSMHCFRYYDTSDRVYYWLDAAPDGGDRNMSFNSSNNPFEDGDQILYFIAVLLLGVLLIVK